MRSNSAKVMTLNLIEQSDRYAVDLYALINAPSYDGGPRTVLSVLACSLSLEHWDAVRCLIRSRLLASAVSVYRAQFEGLVRSLWCLHAATDMQVDKVLAEIRGDTGSGESSLPQTEELLLELSARAPRQASDAIKCFNRSSWEALNMYAHVGLHPMRRQVPGHPSDLLELVLRSANGLAAIGGMHLAIASGHQPLMGEVLHLSMVHASCLSPQP